MAPLIAVTSGEPAGIGPELCLRLADYQGGERLVVLGDRDLLAARYIIPTEATALAGVWLWRHAGLPAVGRG